VPIDYLSANTHVCISHAKKLDEFSALEESSCCYSHWREEMRINSLDSVLSGMERNLKIGVGRLSIVGNDVQG
jgi:hypothetical protein